MVITIVVDLDHLLADPIFDPNRCSINVHPLHSWPAIIVYLVCLLSPNLRIVSLGLLIHMALDGTDCLLLFWLDLLFPVLIYFKFYLKKLDKLVALF